MTTPSAPEAADPADVTAGRERIDELDRRILELIVERAGVSHENQSARVAAGGRRLDLSRESQILATYRETLGKPGVTIAMAVLEFCRGKV
jgi:chorismate mutase